MNEVECWKLNDRNPTIIYRRVSILGLSSIEKRINVNDLLLQGVQFGK